MKKSYWPALLALPAMAFAMPSPRGLQEARLALIRMQNEILAPSTPSPDNLIKRYTFFRQQLYGHMAGEKTPTLAFPWGEPLFFRLENFVEAGEDNWVDDIEDYKSMLTVGGKSAPCYRLWVFERVEDGARQWVIAARDREEPGGVGDDLYVVDADGDYEPHAAANALLQLRGLSPTRANDGELLYCDESMFMTWFYNVLDPARIRMAVVLMDYNDYLLLQIPGVENDGVPGFGGGPIETDDDEAGGDETGDNPANGGTGAVAPAPIFATNVVLGAAGGPYTTPVHTNTAPGALSTRFSVMNISGGGLVVTWAANGVEAGEAPLPAFQTVSQDFEIAAGAGARITVALAADADADGAAFVLEWIQSAREE